MPQEHPTHLIISLLRFFVVRWHLSATLCLMPGFATSGNTQIHLQEKPPPVKDGQYVHIPPTTNALNNDPSIHPALREVILRGRDIFLNTQQFRGQYVFNDMNCKSCHLGEGAMAWSGPVWPAATTLPDFRAKNQHVNSLEERIAGCFTYSMNGVPPAHNSDDMLALVAYHRWLATGAPVYESNIYGRGYSYLGRNIPEATSYDSGETLYSQHCADCHATGGSGTHDDAQAIVPPLWGDDSYNWGAGMSRIFTAASFIYFNMPLGQPRSLSRQDAWDIALFVNSQERPQDPRFDGSARSTRERFFGFHRHTLYGTHVRGRALGEHGNSGARPTISVVE